MFIDFIIIFIFFSIIMERQRSSNSKSRNRKELRRTTDDNVGIVNSDELIVRTGGKDPLDDPTATHIGDPLVDPSSNIHGVCSQVSLANNEDVMGSTSSSFHGFERENILVDDNNCVPSEDDSGSSARTTLRKNKQKRKRRSYDEQDSLRELVLQLSHEFKQFKETRAAELPGTAMAGNAISTKSNFDAHEPDIFQGPLMLPISPVRKPRKDFRLESDKDRPSTPDRSGISLGLDYSYACLNNSKEDVQEQVDRSYDDGPSDSMIDDEGRFQSLRTMKDVRQFIYKTLPENVCPHPPNLTENKGASEFFERDSHKFEALPLSAYVSGAFKDINKFLQGFHYQEEYVPQDCLLKNYSTGNLQTRELLGTERPRIDMFKMAYYKIHSSITDFNRPVPVESCVTSKLDKNYKPSVSLTGKQLEVLEKLARYQTAVASQSDFLLAAIFEAMNGPPENWDKELLNRTLKSLSLSVKHAAQLSARQVANSVLLRRDAYLAALHLDKGADANALRAQPIEANFLFNKKLTEALKNKTKEHKDILIDKAVELKRPRLGSNFNKPRSGFQFTHSNTFNKNVQFSNKPPQGSKRFSNKPHQAKRFFGANNQSSK